jgi:hypothetical protein
LIERHGTAGEPPDTADWVFVISVAAVLLAVLAVPALVLVALMRSISEWLPDSLFQTLLLAAG